MDQASSANRKRGQVPKSKEQETVLNVFSRINPPPHQNHKKKQSMRDFFKWKSFCFKIQKEPEQGNRRIQAKIKEMTKMQTDNRDPKFGNSQRSGIKQKICDFYFRNELAAVNMDPQVSPFPRNIDFSCYCY